MKTIANDKLQLDNLPSSDADWQAIGDFALTFNGYEAWGSLARGEAARIVEDGKAQAAGTQRLAQSWKAAGTSAREIFLFQKLEPLLKTMAAGVPEVEVQNLTVIDAHNGSSVTKMASFLEQLRQATGVDIARVAGHLAGDEPNNGSTRHQHQQDTNV